LITSQLLQVKYNGRLVARFTFEIVNAAQAGVDETINKAYEFL
jgi:hypothetical protein